MRGKIIKIIRDTMYAGSMSVKAEVLKMLFKTGLVTQFPIMH